MRHMSELHYIPHYPTKSITNVNYELGNKHSLPHNNPNTPNTPNKPHTVQKGCRIQAHVTQTLLVRNTDVFGIYSHRATPGGCPTPLAENINEKVLNYFVYNLSFKILKFVYMPDYSAGDKANFCLIPRHRTDIGADWLFDSVARSD